eukprot:9502144-Pyramimonas_sp.AAC.1
MSRQLVGRTLQPSCFTWGVSHEVFHAPPKKYTLKQTSDAKKRPMLMLEATLFSSSLTSSFAARPTANQMQ